MSIDKFLVEYVEPQSTHRVAMAFFWLTFSIIRVKSAQPGEGGGMRALPLSLYLPSRAMNLVRYRVYTEKNGIFRKILILYRLISKIIICLLELHLAVSTNIESFIPN